MIWSLKAVSPYFALLFSSPLCLYSCSDRPKLGGLQYIPLTSHFPREGRGKLPRGEVYGSQASAPCVGEPGGRGAGVNSFHGRFASPSLGRSPGATTNSMVLVLCFKCSSIPHRAGLNARLVDHPTPIPHGSHFLWAQYEDHPLTNLQWCVSSQQGMAFMPALGAAHLPPAAAHLPLPPPTDAPPPRIGAGVAVTGAHGGGDGMMQ